MHSRNTDCLKIVNHCVVHLKLILHINYTSIKKIIIIKTDWLTAKRKPLYKVLGTKMTKIDPGPTDIEFMA